MWKVSKIVIAPFLIIGAVLIYLGYNTSLQAAIFAPGVPASDVSDFFAGDQSLFYIMGAFFIILPLLILIYYKIGNDREMHLVQNGIKGEAKILNVNQTGMYVNNLPQVKFLLQITTPDTESYQVEHKEVVNMIDLGSIRVGAVLPVFVDPQNPKKILLSYR